MRKIAIQDANILIDIEMAELFDLWMRLEIETHTTDLVKEELRRGGHVISLSHIESGEIQSHRLSADDLDEVFVLMREAGAGLDISDCSVLWLAKKINAMVLTGDNALRKITAARGIEVHGTIWIFDALVNAGLLRESAAVSKIEFLLSHGRRLPKDECDKRIRMWMRK